MPRISVNQMTTYRWSLDEDVAHYQSAGVAGIGVWRRKLSDFGNERGAMLLRDSGLAVTSLSYAGDFTGAGGQSFDDSMDDAYDALRLAAQIEAGCLVVMTGSRAGHTRSHARQLVCDALHDLGDSGRALGVQIAVQPMHCQPLGRWTFLTTLEATLDLVTRCNHSQVGMVLDTFHLGREATLCQRMPELAPWVKIAAVCDALRSPRSDDDRCPPGDGILPVGDILRALDECNYQGWYDLQLFGSDCWKSDYRQLIADARHGLQAICPNVFVSRPAAAAGMLATSANSNGNESHPDVVEPVTIERAQPL